MTWFGRILKENPYHDAEGRFTSSGNAGGGTSQGSAPARAALPNVKHHGENAFAGCMNTLQMRVGRQTFRDNYAVFAKTVHDVLRDHPNASTQGKAQKIFEALKANPATRGAMGYQTLQEGNRIYVSLKDALRSQELAGRNPSTMPSVTHTAPAEATSTVFPRGAAAAPTTPAAPRPTSPETSGTFTQPARNTGESLSDYAGRVAAARQAAGVPPPSTLLGASGSLGSRTTTTSYNLATIAHPDPRVEAMAQAFTKTWRDDAKQDHMEKVRNILRSVTSVAGGAPSDVVATTALDALRNSDTPTIRNYARNSVTAGRLAGALALLPEDEQYPDEDAQHRIATASLARAQGIVSNVSGPSAAGSAARAMSNPSAEAPRARPQGPTRSDFDKAGMNTSSADPRSWTNVMGSVTPQEVREQMFSSVLKPGDSMSASAYGSQVSFSFTNSVAQVTRHFTRGSDGSLTVDHAFFQLKNSRETGGKDVAKEFFANSMELYKRIGVSKVSVHANIDVGGYAWAKYGFEPKQSSWDSLRRDFASSISRESTDAEFTPGKKEALLRMLKNPDPRTLWDFSDSTISKGGKPLSKKLMLGSDWYGTLDLQNPAAMERFNDYVGKRKR